MKRGGVFLVFCLLFFLQGILADQIVIQPNPTDGKDTYIQQDDSTMVSGTVTNLDIGQYWINSAKRAILEFDFSSIPSGKVIDNALLTLYMYNAGAGPGTNTNLSTHRVIHAWVEGTSGYTDNGANWFTYNGTANWTTNGGDFNSQVEAYKVTNATGYYSWNITELVRGWYNGSYVNYGVLLKGADEVSDLNLRKRFRSSDWSANVLERPQVIVNYSSSDTIFPLIDFAINTEINNSNFSRNWIFINVSVTETNEDTITFNIYNSTNLINSSSFTNKARTVNFTNLQDGSYFYNVSVNDTTGNTNSTVTRKVTLDTASPLVSYGLGTENSGVKKSQNFIFVNASVSEPNEKSINFSLYNLTGLVNSTAYINGARTINWTFLNDGPYSYNISVDDYAGNTNTTNTRTITLDTTFPLIDFATETEANNSNKSQSWIFMNVEVDESNEKNITFSLYNETGSVSIQTFDDSTREFNFTNLQDGSYFYNVSITDVAGNVNSTQTRRINLDATSPLLILFSPESKVYGDNISLPLNFSASDTNLDSCWYNINNSANVSLANCQNATFNVSSDGLYILNFYVNDSMGSLAKKNVSFSVLTTAPALNLIYPYDFSYLNFGDNIYLNYSVVSGIGVSSCQLWGDFSGTWQINQTNNTINQENNFFVLSLIDGNYTWGVFCNDTQNRNSSINYTFVVDTTLPSLTLTQPSGTKSSRNNVPLTYSAYDLNLNNCWYNVYQGASPEIENTTINCSLNVTTFNVTVDANFVFNFYAEDSAGNLKFANSGFSVDTSVPPSSSSSSGGGGGGSSSSNASIIFGINRLKLQELPKLIMKKGDSKQLTLQVRNAGTNFLNDCQFKAKEGFSSWIKSSGIKDLSAGEIYEFAFELNVPKEAQVRTNTISFELKCKETNVSGSFNVEVIEEKLNFNLIELKREGDNYVRLVYSLQDFSGIEQVVELQFLLSNAEKSVEIKDKQVISAFADKSFGVLIPVDDSLVGELNLLVNLKSDIYSGFVEEDVILGAPISGFTLFGEAGKSDFYLSIGIVTLFFIFAFFKLRNIFSHKKELNKRKKINVLKKSNKDKLIIIKRKSK